MSKTAPVVSRMNCSGLRTSSARLSASSARLRLPSRTQIWPSEASATPSPWGVPALLLQLDAAFGERQRLLVPMLHQRDVGLVAADRRQDVAGLDEHRQALGLRERRHRLVETSFLRERHARQRVHHRQVPAIADGMERRRRLGQVLADDAGVADLAIAEAQFEVREANRAGIVSALGGLEGLGEEGDAAGRFAAGSGEAAVHPPEVREARGIEAFPGFGRSPQGLGGLTDVVLQQPGLGERAPHLHLLFALEPRPLERAHKEGRRIRAPPLLERPNGLTVEVWRRHGATVYLVYRRCQAVNRERRAADHVVSGSES